MKRCIRIPVLVDVVAHLFDQFRDEMRAVGTMAAPLDINVSWTEVTSIRTDTVKSRPMEVENHRRTKLELSVRLQPLVDHLTNDIELTEGVTGLQLGQFVRIGYNPRVFRPAMPLTAIVVMHAS